MPTTTPQPTVSDSLQKETQRKRNRIAHSWWPHARLVAEILYYEIDHTRTFSQAAALTYKTLFSLLPIFVLSLLLLSTISSAGGGTALDATLERFFFKEFSLDKLRVTRTDPTPADTAPDASDAGGGTGDKPTQTVSAEQMVAPIIKSAKDAVTSPTTGLVAFAILLYGSISLMIVIEGSFNLIYGACKARSWPRRIMLYWCVLTLGPIGIAASLAFGHAAYATASSIAGRWALLPFDILASFLFSWLLVFLLYKLIPDTRVNWKSALLGSFIAAVLWEAGKWGFGIYIRRALAHSWYGSLALIPLFMLWIYLTWCAILLGLQSAYLHQFFPTAKAPLLLLPPRHFHDHGRPLGPLPRHPPLPALHPRQRPPPPRSRRTPHAPQRHRRPPPRRPPDRRHRPHHQIRHLRPRPPPRIHHRPPPPPRRPRPHTRPPRTPFRKPPPPPKPTSSPPPSKNSKNSNPTGPKTAPSSISPQPGEED